jgi:putative endonuclease
LVRAGFTIVERNWLVRRADVRGEIDIIARRSNQRGDSRSDLVVFCEVKARRNDGYGGAAIAVDAGKRERLRLVAQLFLIERGLSDVDVRFDVIAITGTELHHYEAAF